MLPENIWIKLAILLVVIGISTWLIRREKQRKTISDLGYTIMRNEGFSNKLGLRFDVLKCVTGYFFHQEIQKKLSWLIRGMELKSGNGVIYELARRYVSNVSFDFTEITDVLRPIVLSSCTSDIYFQMCALQHLLLQESQKDDFGCEVVEGKNRLLFFWLPERHLCIFGGGNCHTRVHAELACVQDGEKFVIGLGCGISGCCPEFSWNVKFFEKSKVCLSNFQKTDLVRISAGEDAQEIITRYPGEWILSMNKYRKFIEEIQKVDGY